MLAAAIPLKSALHVNWGESMSCGSTQPANSFHVTCSLVDGGCIVPVGVSEVHGSMQAMYLESPRSPQESQDSHSHFSFYDAILKLAPAL